MSGTRNMRALSVTGVRRLDLVTLPVPEPGPGEVLVRVAWCGICGSDVPRYFEGGVHSFPQVLGHEFSGEIAALGPGVTDRAVGERVAVAPLVPCGHCTYCQKGRPALCAGYSFIGSRRQGAIADYVAVPDRNALPVPGAMSLRSAALVEPLTVAVHGVERTRVRTGALTMVLGAGVVGLMTVMVLLAKGARVLVCDIDPAKVAVAGRLGARAGTDAAELVAGEAPEIVIETAGSALTQAMALELVAKDGQVAYVGTGHGDLVLGPGTFERILRGELAVTGSWMSYSAPFPGYEWPAAVGLIASGAVDAESMVTGEYALDDGPRAFEDIRDPHGLRLKLLYRLSGR
ncbi:galactitol-1-phosphate 5-dehydrogenase [uncultured Propionibacterium sp.]|uniref:galactitol-1-phosphate 5-dehydrogenase n=1 Tax=uncultured Propionibacterium sp. TaxID=218066 RepID=UPI002930EE55|nr:galactitol-1-phosphate 5-dehydrogenase [uncultured Propionibacterium sp.]